MAGLYGVSEYMLSYSIGYPKEERMTAEHWKNRMKGKCPWTVAWMDSVYLIAKGSIHAMAYRDHHQKYTQKVKELLNPKIIVDKCGQDL